MPSINISDWQSMEKNPPEEEKQIIALWMNHKEIVIGARFGEKILYQEGEFSEDIQYFSYWIYVNLPECL